MPAFTKRLATNDSFETQPTALEGTVFADGLCCVLGTAGREPAMLAQKRAQNQLVGTNDGEENLIHCWSGS